jgi:hypothetical protein
MEEERCVRNSSQQQQDETINLILPEFLITAQKQKQQVANLLLQRLESMPRLLIYLQTKPHSMDEILLNHSYHLRQNHRAQECLLKLQTAQQRKYSSDAYFKLSCWGFALRHIRAQAIILKFPNPRIH